MDIKIKHVNPENRIFDNFKYDSKTHQVEIKGSNILIHNLEGKQLVGVFPSYHFYMIKE